MEMKRLELDAFIAETERMKAQAEIQARAQTAVEVARINADARKDVAAVGALTQLEMAGLQPSVELQAELNEPAGES
jgi:hypothetical protein